MKSKMLKALLAQMTLEEKIGQLTQLDGSFFATDDQEITGPIYAENHINEEDVYRLGSVLGVYGAETTRRIQSDYLAKSRLKIPLLFMGDVIHGARTIFPIPLGLATSWNPELVRQTAEAAAREATAAGLHVTFAPMVDLVRDARWGRVMESTGEDPYLNARLAEAHVRGFQGERFDKRHLAACVKHFAAYGAVEAGRDYNIVDLPENKLREVYLPAYKAAIDAGVALVMTSFNTVNGVPATGNQWLMKTLLREEWGFDGVLITDYGAVLEQISWGTARNTTEAAQKAFAATVDIEMMTTAYLQSLPALLEAGQVDAAQLDEAVLRVLELKEKLGLFKDPYRGASPAAEARYTFNVAKKKLAERAADESIVLLKNENQILPLLKYRYRVGFYTALPSNDLLGAWSWKGDQEETESLEDYLRLLYPIDFWETTRRGERVVLFVGETSDRSGEAKSYSDIRLPREQVDYINKVAASGSYIILVVLAGRPLDLSEVEPKVKAILYVYFPGTMGAKAVAHTLFGKKNPSAKLTMSLPRSVGQLPLYYNHYNTGRPTQTEEEEYVSRYQDVAKTPLYPFGYGLSYTSFAYDDCAVVFDGEKIQVSGRIRNVGEYDGAEIVQIYIHDRVASTVRPLKELKAFDKLFLEVGKSKMFHLTIDKAQLKFYNFNNQLVFEPGEFEVFIGQSSEQIVFSTIIDIS